MLPPLARCEVKVIDLGSSCFTTDQLSSYVQSRSYRAPEVILGLPYNQKVRSTRILGLSYYQKLRDAHAMGLCLDSTAA